MHKSVSVEYRILMLDLSTGFVQTNLLEFSSTRYLQMKYEKITHETNPMNSINVQSTAHRRTSHMAAHHVENISNGNT